MIDGRISGLHVALHLSNTESRDSPFAPTRKSSRRRSSTKRTPREPAAGITTAAASAASVTPGTPRDGVPSTTVVSASVALPAATRPSTAGRRPTTGRTTPGQTPTPFSSRGEPNTEPVSDKGPSELGNAVHRTPSEEQRRNAENGLLNRAGQLGRERKAGGRQYCEACGERFDSLDAHFNTPKHKQIVGLDGTAGAMGPGSSSVGAAVFGSGRRSAAGGGSAVSGSKTTAMRAQVVREERKMTVEAARYVVMCDNYMEWWLA